MTLVSVSAFAHGVERGSVDYRKIGDALNGDVQNEINQYVSQNCAIENKTFSAVNVEVREERIDQGVIDFFYTVDFEVLVDGVVVGSLQLEVEDIAISNPAFDPVNVIRAKSTGVCVNK